MKKIFWDDPYLTTCRARVVSIDGRKVRVDQTIFYAFSGGQLCDEGTIGGIKVVEACKQGDKEDIVDIEYTLEEEPTFGVGDEVEIVIDGERRDRLRRLHSAAHIVYYFVIAKLGKVSINGSEIQVEKARMDFGYDGSIVEALGEIEKEVNAFILEGHEIIMKPDGVKQDLKWWTCEDWKMPCGGTHVRNTTEIGPLRLARKNKGKGRERIEMYLVE